MKITAAPWPIASASARQRRRADARHGCPLRPCLRGDGGLRPGRAAEKLAALDAVAPKPADVGVRVDADGAAQTRCPGPARAPRAVDDEPPAPGDRPAVLARELDDVAAQTNTPSREQWQMQARAALGIDLQADPDVRPMLTDFRDQGVGLIRSPAARRSPGCETSDAGAG